MMIIFCAILSVNTLTSHVSAGSGFDSIDCDPQSYNRVRTGRARLVSSIPCDLTKQSYCNMPGEAYPWNAMKKFVYENQGLVRRMYGDIRHIFVMQSEIENEVDSDDFKHFADKYSKAFNNNQQHNERNSHREMKSRKIVEKKNFRSDSEPYFRPSQKTSVKSTVKPEAKPAEIVKDLDVKAHETGEIILKNSDQEQDILVVLNSFTTNDNENEEKLAVTSSTSTPLSTVSTASPVSDGLITNNSISVAEETTKNSNISKSHELEIKSPELVVVPILGDNQISTSTLKTSSTSTSSILPVNISTTTESENEEDIADMAQEETIQVDIFDELRSVFSSDSNSTSKPTLSRVPPPLPSPITTTTSTTEAQLFQDSIFSRDKEPAPVVNRKGVNACPVKEEVVAPFWGNNTRGEILALLNVYPYEQYINWEKCTNEHEQMMCRRGCKCEQQYRLHRLLAYNPLDACRGIFSDWFRFPSCCICKCYDMPFDFRVTSRSPRGAERILNDDEDTLDKDGENFENYYEDDKSNDNLAENVHKRMMQGDANLERPLQ